MTLTDAAELYICAILTVEFWYDYWYNNLENRRKRRTQKKKHVEFDHLNSGEGR